MKKRLESEAGCRRCYFKKHLFRLAGLQDLAGFDRICPEYSFPQTSFEMGAADGKPSRAVDTHWGRYQNTCREAIVDDLRFGFLK